MIKHTKIRTDFGGWVYLALYCLRGGVTVAFSTRTGYYQVVYFHLSEYYPFSLTAMPFILPNQYVVIVIYGTVSDEFMEFPVAMMGLIYDPLGNLQTLVKGEIEFEYLSGELKNDDNAPATQPTVTEASPSPEPLFNEYIVNDLGTGCFLYRMERQDRGDHLCIPFYGLVVSYKSLLNFNETRSPDQLVVTPYYRCFTLEVFEDIAVACDPSGKSVVIYSTNSQTGIVRKLDELSLIA